MSKDIRSFFKLQNKTGIESVKFTNGTAKKKAILSDDDVIPESPDIVKQKDKKQKRRRIIDDSSDEEIFLEEKHLKQEIRQNNKQIKKEIKKTEKVLKEVTPFDLFGTGPIKRTEIPKREKPKQNIEIHSDEDFDKTLIDLDVEKLKSNINSKEVSSKGHPKDSSCISINSPVKNNNVPQIKENKSKEECIRKIHEHKTKHENNKADKSQSYGSVENGKIVKKSPQKLDKTSPQKLDKTSPHKLDKTSPQKIDKKIPQIIDIRLTNCKNGQKNFNVERIEKKRDFEEFVSDDLDDADSSSPPNTKKRKHNSSLNESVLSDEERHERKRYSAALYQKYLNRSGPKHLGAKQLPQGKSDCLLNLSFLLTGVLDSFERDEIVDAITNYGGCIKSSVSKKVNYIIAGEDAGPAKLAKAEELKIPILNEDEFIQLIKTNSGIKKSPRPEEKVKINGIKEIKIEKKEKVNKGDVKEVISRHFYGKKEKDIYYPFKNEAEEKEAIEVKDELIKEINAAINSRKSLMWVDKYKPQSVKQIVGQHGDASNVKKLIKWLTAWYVNRKQNIPKPSPWSKNDDGAYYKAALLSGPPGIGKTTTVSLVCKELGFDMVEFNASDTRSKSMLKDEIQQMLSTNSLAGFVKGSKSITKKKVLVMDEVDGMAGNEDRGGLQELITLIKTSPVPIICMCNDRNSTKMRSLVNYCYDLRFNRPRLDQIRSFLMSVCCREGVKVPPDVLVQIITTANQDIRQSLTLLSLYAGAQLTSNALKDVKMGPWEAVRKVFSASEHKDMSIHDKSDLFFSDYSLAPLFVQENYLSVAPQCPKNQVLKRIAAAADSISYGDLIEAKIRGSGAWGLLPMQAMFSSVIPGSMMAGTISGQIQFPGWLGKNSRGGKLQRLATMIHAHTRLSASGSKESVLMDYADHILRAIAIPLTRDGLEGVNDALEVMKSYHLIRDDLDAMAEIALWPGRKDPMQGIEAKVKAAFTRTFNKEVGSLPYAPVSFKKMAHTSTNSAEDELLEETEEDGGQDSDADSDLMIKKKSKASAKPSKSKSDEKPDRSKKGKGKRS